MEPFDLIIRNGTLVTAAEAAALDIGVSDGRIVALQPGLQGSAREMIDAGGLHIFPGLIDSHVHFNEPGRTDWEGFVSGSRALAAGGGTVFFDMPLNAHPPTIDAAGFDLKLEAAKAGSLVDFCLWGGLVPDNLDQLEPLSERGVIGFKAFMANSGVEDFPCVDEGALRAGMKRAASLNQIVAVHAESETMVHERTQRLVARGLTSAADFLASRPIEAELDAIGRAVELAGETGCSLHVVHVSCGAGVALIVSARDHGVDVTCETCPHYLILDEEDLKQLGPCAKCAPPLRPKSAQQGLWHYLETGHVATIGSDHSPSPPELKTGENFFEIWGGISGIQHTFPLLLDSFRARGLALPLLAKLTSLNVAERFRLPPAKGRLTIGADADLVLADVNSSVVINPEDLLDRHRQSPYRGRTLTGKVIQTILRGRTIYRNNRIVSEPLGRLVTPQIA